MKSKAIYILLALFALGCSRDEEDLPQATFPNTSEIFTDVPVGLTDAFFISFDPAAGANPNGFGVDENEAFEGTTSIRIDVPDANDPNGGFIGGIFVDRGNGRNLTEYNALTFWARASTTATVGLFGFGTDFESNEFAASISDVLLSTKWTKIVIPIPDASKLVQEKGMFIFSAGSQSTGGKGYTFWMDEMKFENLSTVAQPFAQIFEGNDEEVESFNGVTIPVTGLQVVLNVDGADVPVNVSPSYFNFQSSDPSIASVSNDGQITVNQEGSAVITGDLGEGDNQIDALGSITVTSSGDFIFAPTPPERDPANVLSLFSDAYNTEPVSRYNSFFEPFQTTLGGVVEIVGQEIISYTDLNFVGIVFGDDIFPAEAVPEFDLTDFDRFHIDINVREELQGSDQLLIQLTDYSGGGVGTLTLGSGSLQSGAWASVDVPLSSFFGLTNRSEIGLLLFDSGGNISDIWVDNIYFYKE